MKEKRVIEGICALCGKQRKLSFEHVPPRAAFNNAPISVQNHVHLTDQTSHLYGKKMRSNKGSGGYTLCEDCNNKTGVWYASDFADFVHQGMSIIRELKTPSRLIKGVYQIKPLNVLKQILTMFMSTDKSGYLRSKTDLVDFILHKEKTGLPTIYEVYLYSTLSTKYRMFGFSWIADEIMGLQKWSEINFKPFGYLLAEESGPAHEYMCNISKFGNFSYDERVFVELTTGYLHIDSEWIGTYK